MVQSSSEIILYEGAAMHFARERDNPNSRILYRGELAPVEQ